MLGVLKVFVTAQQARTTEATFTLTLVRNFGRKLADGTVLT